MKDRQREVYTTSMSRMNELGERAYRSKRGKKHGCVLQSTKRRLSQVV